MHLPPSSLPVVAALAALLASPARAEAPGSSSPLADDATLVALAVSLACADAPEQHQGVPGPEVTPPPDLPAEGPELELVATVRAKALRFEKLPKVNVAFTGTGPRRTVWKTERVNLPMNPQAGVTYRDVQVRLTVTSTLEGLTDLLAQAKHASRGVLIEGIDGAPAADPAAAVAPASHGPAMVVPAAAPAAPAAPSATPPPAAAGAVR